MKSTLGFILLFVGLALVLWAMYDALMPLINYYRANLDNPMAQPDGAEQQLSSTMLRALVKGGIGVVPLIAGGVLLKVSFIQRLRRKAQERVRRS